MPKRSATEAVMQAVTRADSSGLPRHKSRSGRVVKPKVGGLAVSQFENWRLYCKMGCGGIRQAHLGAKI
jgi:hypothetical protein